jgi:hypothetical protein
LGTKPVAPPPPVAAPNRFNLSQPGPLRPVPKVSAQPKPPEDEPEDFDLYDFQDEGPAPRQSNQPGSGFNNSRESSPGSNTRPTRPPF